MASCCAPAVLSLSPAAAAALLLSAERDVGGVARKEMLLCGQCVQERGGDGDGDGNGNRDGVDDGERREWWWQWKRQ